MSALQSEDGHLDPLRDWEQALDRLERDLSLAERVLAHPHADLDGLQAGLGSWEPPAPRGLLPEALAGRARAIEQRQARVREGLERALAGTRAGIDRARRTSTASSPSAPAYVDVSA